MGQSARRAPLRIRWFIGPALAVVLGACGGTADVESAGTTDEVGQSTTPSVEDIAAANIPLLETADDPIDVEVVSVSDGSVASLRAAVDGDRAVLVWFYAPH
jgi:hypothetical protein